MSLSGVFAATQHVGSAQTERILGDASNLTQLTRHGALRGPGEGLSALSAPPDNLEALGRELEGRAEARAEAIFAFLCAELGFVRATERLEGDLACAAIQGSTLWIRRGRVGREPLVWAEIPGGIAFSTQPRALARALELPLVGPETFEERGVFLPPDTPWRGLRALAPGEGLCVSPAGVKRLPPEPLSSLAGRAGKPEIWAKALHNALSLATARVGVPFSLSLSDGLASGVLRELLRRREPGLLTVGVDVPGADRSIPLPEPSLLRELPLDAPLGDPTLLLDAAALRAAPPGGLVSGRGAAEILGGILPRAPRARLRALVRGPDGRAAEALDRARRELPERTLAPLLQIAQGRRLETPYATALVVGVAALIPAEHLRGRALLNAAFAELLSPELRGREHRAPEVPLTEWLRALGEEPGADPGRAWRRAAWRVWREGLP